MPIGLPYVFGLLHNLKKGQPHQSGIKEYLAIESGANPGSLVWCYSFGGRDQVQGQRSARASVAARYWHRAGPDIPRSAVPSDCFAPGHSSRRENIYCKCGCD